MNTEKKENISGQKKYAWEKISSPEQLTNKMAWQIFRIARWNGETPKCIYCGHHELRRMKHKNLNYCPKCKKNFSDRHGTPYNKARISMEKIIFFIILARKGIPINRIYQILGISKTSALRLFRIIRKCSIADSFIKICLDIPLSCEKIIYSLAPDFDSDFKYKKKYHLLLQQARKSDQNVMANGSNPASLKNPKQSTDKEYEIYPVANDMFCRHGVAGGCRRCYGT